MRFWVRLICAIVIVWQVATTLPAPGPGPKPNPPIPVIEGQRIAVIIRETEDESPAFARMVVALRNGDHAAYLAAKGHTLYVYDQHQQDDVGQPLELVQTLLPLHSQLPALFILDGSDGRPLHHETLPADVTADDVLAILKGAGG
jgi:hypothetical protein